MTRRPSAAEAIAMKAAAAVAAQDQEEEAAEMDAAEQASPEPAVPAFEPSMFKSTIEQVAAVKLGAPRGRPKGRRPVASRQTVYLDERRHAALARIAEDRGRSIHSLILEGIDHVIGKPAAKGWEQ
ncbi:hypothetical protein [Methylobacterium persicinum]|uniref:Stability/partitioning determinant n=1 Tax=Methylobacterium persicinum TaxID=374426 RepID=A0ABU0HTA8_9HYPH|nr:hypothetical protein [Methylobacterium persicinum]MDQ0445152.1 hypothetical protein [Methylobacterium persicinum]GJE39068.1 hypothetical protein KHHGKMAE_3147 [Methylobacterium persicinum]